MKPWIVLLALGMALCGPTFAHLLKIDRDIGVLMHIDPGDSPVAREKATLFFDIQDRTGRFGAAQCDCRFRIQKEGAEVFEGKLLLQNAQSTAAVYSFPEAGVYRVQVTGAPQMGAVFQAFSVGFDLRVEHGEAERSWTEELLAFWPLWTVLGLVLAGWIAVLAKNR